MAELDHSETVRDKARRFLAVQKMHAKTAQAARAVFDSPDGKLVLAWLAKSAGMLETTVAIDGTGRCDPDMSLVNAGKRILFLEIVTALRWTEGEILALAQQRTEEQIAAQSGE